jgi:hypothetical protein
VVAFTCLRISSFDDLDHQSRRTGSPPMNLGGLGASHTLAPSSPSHQYFPAKRSHSAQSSSSISPVDLRELTNTLQELNTSFKRNIKVLTEIKDYIVKVCEKQDARPVDDNSGVHKLEKVSLLSFCSSIRILLKIKEEEEEEFGY